MDARIRKGGSEFTERQKAVLDAALSLLVESGDSLTMADVARRASCSKETLYKWFGGRDGLLTATVRWQASRVRAVAFDRAHLDVSKLSAGLKQFAVDWLTVISGQTSIALNRIAISHASLEKARLGAVVLANGRFAMGNRLKPLLEAARDAGILSFDDSEEAFRTFFGLVGRDVQIRLLLGERLPMTTASIDREAGLAARQFLALFGSGEAKNGQI